MTASPDVAMAAQGRSSMTIAMVALLAVAVIALAVMLFFLLAPAQSVKTETALQQGGSAQVERVGEPGGIVASTPEEKPADSDGSAASDEDWSRSGAAELPPDHNGITAVNGSSGSGALSSHDAYKRLVSFLDGASSFDKKIADCATDFNAGYLAKSADDRKAKAKQASTLKSQVKRKWDEIEKLDMPFWSPNYDEWGDICELYECLWHRIDVIDRAWAISLKYDDPEKHKDEILAPIIADQEGGQNKYYLRYNELCPTIKLENA